MLVAKANVKDMASSVKRFAVRRIPPNVCHLRTSTMKCGAALASRCVLSAEGLGVSVRVRRGPARLRNIAVATSPFQHSLRDPMKLHVVKLRRVRGDPKTGHSVSHMIRSCPNMTFSPTKCHGSLVMQNNSPSRGHFCLSKIRVPGVGRFDARNTSNNPMNVVGTSFVERMGFCAKTFPTSQNGSLDSILSFGLHSKSVRQGSLGTALNTSRMSLTSGKRLNGGASCLISIHRSCLRFLFSVLKLPLLPAFASTRFGLGAHFSRHGRLAMLNLTNVSGVGLGADLRNRGTRCVLDCLPGVRRRAFALKTICHRCTKTRMRSIIVDRDCLGGHGAGCLRGSRSARRGLALQLHSMRRRAGLELRGDSAFKT